MLTFQEFINDRWFWAWLSSSTAFIAVTIVLLQKVRRVRVRQLRQLLRCEQGAAYTLIYTLTFPFYLLTIVVAFELSVVMMVNIQAKAAAYDAARAACVWAAAQPAGREDFHAHAAAAQRLFATASGFAAHQQSFSTADPRGPLFRQAFDELGGESIAYHDTYLESKARYANSNTSVSLSREEDAITATVTYRLPLHTPGAGRVLGTKLPGTNFYAMLVRKAVTLPIERPQTPDGTFGVEYRSQ